MTTRARNCFALGRDAIAAGEGAWITSRLDRFSPEAEAGGCAQEMPVVAPDLRETGVACRHEMDRIACPQVQTSGKIVKRRLDVPENTVRNREQSPRTPFDVLQKGFSQCQSLRPTEPFFPNMALENTGELGEAQGGCVQVRFAFHQPADQSRVGFVNVAFRHVRGIQVDAQDRSSSRNLLLSPRTCGNRASQASRSGRERACDLGRNGRSSATGTPRRVMTTVRPNMVSLMTALVRKCNSRIVRSFMCYIVTHNWTERQFLKITYLNTECGINRVAIRSARLIGRFVRLALSLGEQLTICTFVHTIEK